MKSFIIIAVLFCMAFISCEKKDIERKFPIEGLWIGTYLADNHPDQPPYYFSFIIKPGGNLLVETKFENASFTANGTWTLSNNIFNANFIYNKDPQGNEINQTATAEFDQSGVLTGEWEDMYGTGTFILNRIN